MSTINVADNCVSSSTILCLDIDCLEELFEWLPLRDLRSLRASCKRMKRAVDYHIKTTYPNRFGTLQLYDPNVHRDLRNFKISAFCKLFKHIDFSGCPLIYDLGDDLANIMQHIEKVTITSDYFDGDFHERFLQVCKNLKYFHVTAAANEWMNRECPTIEHFVMMDRRADYMPELQTFLELNSNIQRISLMSSFIHQNEVWMTESNIKVNHLDIEVNCEFEGDNLLFEMCNVLDTLHKRGFYKKLHLYIISKCKQTYLDKIAMVPGLNKLYLEGVSENVLWPSLMQLDEFSMDNAQKVYNIDALVENSANIQRIYFQSAGFDEVLPFINRSAKLKQLKIYSPKNDTYSNGSVIDLAELNKERAKCSNGSKITMYVKEDVFLETKQTLMQTDFQLIELKRAETYDWRFHFSSNYDD